MACDETFDPNGEITFHFFLAIIILTFYIFLLSDMMTVPSLQVREGLCLNPVFSQYSDVPLSNMCWCVSLPVLITQECLGLFVNPLMPIHSLPPVLKQDEP